MRTGERTVKVTINLTKAQALAALKSEGLTNGRGVMKSKALQQAERRILDAIQDAWNNNQDGEE